MCFDWQYIASTLELIILYDLANKIDLIFIFILMVSKEIGLEYFFVLL